MIHYIAHIHDSNIYNKTLISDSISPVCLPDATDSDHAGDQVTITGWGLTTNNKRSDVLRKTTAFVISNDQCKQSYMSTVNSGIICTSSDMNGGTCSVIIYTEF